MRCFDLGCIPFQVLDSYIFAFWAKMPVDVEPKRIRLKSNSYTTNTILDTVTAASVQVGRIFVDLIFLLQQFTSILASGPSIQRSGILSTSATDTEWQC